MLHTYAGGEAKGRCLYVAGVPGTGKTALVLETMQAAKQRVRDGQLPHFQFVEINALRLPSPHHAYVCLHEVGGKKKEKSSMPACLHNRVIPRKDIRHYKRGSGLAVQNRSSGTLPKCVPYWTLNSPAGAADCLAGRVLSWNAAYKRSSPRRGSEQSRGRPTFACR